MPYRILRRDWVPAMKERLSLEEGAPTPLYLADVVVPVIDVAKEIAQAYPFAGDYTYTAAESGLVEIYQVPDNIRIRVRRLVIYRSTGDNTFTHIYLASQRAALDGSATTQIIYEYVAAGRTAIHHNPDLYLDPNDVIKIYLSGAGSAGGIMRCYLWGEQVLYDPGYVIP